MASIKAYILSVAAAALLCTICTRLLSGQSTASSTGKMLTGLFLLFSVISPLRNMRVGSILDYTEELKLQASQAQLQGETASNNAIRASIISQVEAYILNKAESLNAKLHIKVTLSEEEIPVPVQIHISGDISPYAKMQLQRMIEIDLGVAKENQIWT